MNATLDNGETCANICALIDTYENPYANFKGGFDVSLPADGFNTNVEGISVATSGGAEPLTTFCKKIGECPAVDPNANASGGKSSSFTLLYSHSKKCF